MQTASNANDSCLVANPISGIDKTGRRRGAARWPMVTCKPLVVQLSSIFTRVGLAMVSVGSEPESGRRGYPMGCISWALSDFESEVC